MRGDITIQVTMPPEHAYAFARFTKRVSLFHYKQLAVDLEQAYKMLFAGEAIHDALVEAGYDPK